MLKTWYFPYSAFWSAGQWGGGGGGAIAPPPPPPPWLRYCNGVRKGSILSPLLFAIYMNELSLVLNKLNIGCFIGNRCLNNIMYADDICCLAPSFKGLQKLLDICCDYANRHDITFNCTKTKTMMFKTNRLSLSFEPKFRLCGNSIDCVKKIFRFCIDL